MSRVSRSNLWVCLAACLLAGAQPAGAQAPARIADRAVEGAAAMRESRFAEAATIYEELVRQRPSNAGLLMNLGMARYMSGDAASAVEPLQKAAKLSPDLAPAALFLGSALFDLGRPREAIPPLERAVKALPDNPDARDMLGRACLSVSRFVDAAAQYRVLTRLQPANPRAWLGLVHSYQGITENALAELQSSAPDSPLLELLVADVAVTQDKFAAALAIYRRVMAAGLPVGGLHEAVADLYDRAGHPDWAATERAKATRPSATVCATRPAECHYLAGRYQQSLAAALASRTPSGRYWTIRAANRLATEAVGHLDTLPESVELHLVRAEIAQARGQNPDAVREVQAALALDPGDRAIQTALAEAFLRARDLEHAVPLLERLTRAAPDEPTLQLMLGDALLEQQQIDRAIPVLERAAAPPKGLPQARASLGRAYVQAGRFNDALPHLEAAVTNEPDVETYLQLARTYQALGRREEAQKAMSEYQAAKQQQAVPPPDRGPEPELTPPE
jgi:predicted Zn-dependent protease